MALSCRPVPRPLLARVGLCAHQSSPPGRSAVIARRTAAAIGAAGARRVCGECREVLDGAGARLAADAPAIGVHEPGDVYARDDFVYWGFSPEGLRRLGRIVGLDEFEVVDELEIDGHPRIVALLRAAG